MIAHGTDKNDFVTFSLCSGSSGNCIFIAAGGYSVLIDSGLSGAAAKAALSAVGLDINRVDALLISHDHNDHSRSAGIFHRKFSMPIYCTDATYKTIAPRIGSVDDVRFFAGGDSFEIGPLTIHTQPTPHDGVDGVCFVVEFTDRRIGVLTDLGFVFPELEEIIPRLDGVYLESNYDPDMLDFGPYPPVLKRRIRGDGGHISNDQAAALLDDFASDRMQWAMLSHLSEQNNSAACAKSCVLKRLHKPLVLDVAPRSVSSSLLRIQ